SEPGTLSAAVGRYSTGGARLFFLQRITSVSYQVLARKWRPQTFEDVVGQTSITQTLANAIRLDRIGHAFLFSGSRGIGKTNTARILAKALNCEHGPTPEPCNECRHCREITSGIAMDVIEIDGASNRGIDEIRELRENVKYSPATTRYKVVIIDEVHMLTREAFNALLKTLEEPPEHAKFILATTEPHKVPVTIISRCQRYDFRRIDVATLAAFLGEICKKEKISVQDQTLEVLARMADGGLRDSLSLLDQVISYSGQEINHEQTMELLGRIDPELLFDVFRSIADGTGSKALKRFSEYIDGGGDETVFNREMMELTRDIMTLKMGGKAHANVPGNIPDMFSIDQLERIFHVLLNQEQAFRYTEHPRLLMDVALIKMSHIQQLTPLEDILGRLDAISNSRNNLPQKPQQFQQTTTKRTPPRPLSTQPDRPAIPKRMTNPIARPEQTISATPGRPSSPASTTPAPSPYKKKSTIPAPPENRQHGNNGRNTTTSRSIPEDDEPQPRPSSPKHLEDKPDRDNSPLRLIMTSIANAHAPLKGMLSYAAVEKFDKSTLSLVFHPDYRIHLDLLQKYDDVGQILSEAAVAVFGSDRQISYHIGDFNSPRAVIDQDIIGKQQAREKRMDLARNQPVVAKIAKMFRGEIVDIQIKKQVAPTIKETAKSNKTLEDNN
ncbi:DNA polymerase III subunit gamma/tau, partial [bacterium]|nr:DNA polymerase III subunit gamma/tau [bacterium]